MLNGVPGKKFYCKRGVRQGDTLSFLLFVLAADLLQSVLNKAMAHGLLSAPLEVPSCRDFPVIQYADDTLLVMQAESIQLCRHSGNQGTTGRPARAHRIFRKFS